MYIILCNFVRPTLNFVCAAKSTQVEGSCPAEDQESFHYKPQASAQYYMLRTQKKLVIDRNT